MNLPGNQKRDIEVGGGIGWMGWPNVLTLARLFAVPLIVWLILAGRMAPAFCIFVLAGLSDAADGFLAKRYECVTEFGRHLDPLADKALLVSVYITLGHAGYLPIWLVILVVFRDTLIIGGILFLRLLNGELRLQPIFISKLNTTMQIVLAAFVLAVLGLGIHSYQSFNTLIMGATNLLIIIVALTTLTSGIAYLFRWGLGPAGVTRKSKETILQYNASKLDTSEKQIKDQTSK